jgi:hypothetical protein
MQRRAGMPLAEKYDRPFVFDKVLVSVASPVKSSRRDKAYGSEPPALDAVIEWTRAAPIDSFAKRAVLIDPNIASPQRYWLVRSEHY